MNVAMYQCRIVGESACICFFSFTTRSKLYHVPLLSTSWLQPHINLSLGRVFGILSHPHNAVSSLSTMIRPHNVLLCTTTSFRFFRSSSSNGKREYEEKRFFRFFLIYSQHVRPKKKYPSKNVKSTNVNVHILIENTCFYSARHRLAR